MEFMPITPYFVRSKDEVAKLQHEATELRATVKDPKASWIERSRAEARLHTVERELQMARTAQRQAEQAQQSATPCAVTQMHEPVFAEPVSYFEDEEPGRAAPIVGNAAPVPWPAEFAERTALLAAAMDELRRISAAR